MHRFCLFLVIGAMISLAYAGTPLSDKSSSTHAQAAGGALLLNEISPWPSDDVVWVEFINYTGQPVDPHGWSIEFLSGYSYAFPSNSATIPAGGLHLLNISGGGAVNPDGDGCVLHGPNGPVDVITWGLQTRESRLPLSPGGPLLPPYGVLSDDGLFQDDDVIFRAPGTWPPENVRFYGSDHWAYRSVDEATPGEPNNHPMPFNYSPADGARIASDVHLSILGQRWTAETTFQVASDEEFLNIVYEETVADNGVTLDSLAGGTYYWRVRESSGDENSWSSSREFTVAGYDIDELIAAAEARPGSSHEVSRLLASSKSGGSGPPDLFVGSEEELVAWNVIGVSHKVQRKDTDMVCLDGCPMDGAESWEDPHSSTGMHGRLYCSRACLSMIASSAGCNLSQDRITYFIYQESGTATRDAREFGQLDEPWIDLGHNLGTYTETTVYALEWIYEQSHGTGRILPQSPDWWYDTDTPEMDSVREFLDDGRPLVGNRVWHSTVVDGYAVLRNVDDHSVESRWIHVLDPANSGDISWLDYDTSSNFAYCAPPPTGIPMRCDEPEVSMDSDGDMLVDFDETERFETDPHNEDTDGDGLDDMVDMIGYLFAPDGTYRPDLRDYDMDGNAKELDPDNDHENDDGVIDGCEDVNLNGFFDEDGTETNCFLFADDFDILSPYCFSGFIIFEAEIRNVVIPGAVVQTKETILIENGQPTSSRQYIYDHTWTLTSSGFTLETPQGNVTSTGEGESTGLASIQIQVDGRGKYTMVTDCRPRVSQYVIDTTGPGISRMVFHDFHLYAADHHFDYISPEAPPIVDMFIQAVDGPNVFIGNVTHDPDGGTLVDGFDELDVAEFFPGMEGSVVRTWEIWIDRE